MSLFRRTARRARPHSGGTRRSWPRTTPAPAPAPAPAPVEGLESRTLFASGALDPGFSGDGIAYPTPGGTFAVVSTDHRGGRTVVLGSTNYETSEAGPTAGTANILVLNAAGNLDTTFSGDGVRPMPRLTDPRDVFVQPDGKILVVGTVDGVAGVARMLANGASDTSFSGDGFATFPQFDVATGVRLTPSNRVVVSGYRNRTGEDRVAVGRALANGGVDTQFSGDGQAVLDVQGRANAVAVQPDGRIVLVGTIAVEDPGNVAVVRLTTGGSNDPSFGLDGLVTYDSADSYAFPYGDDGQAVDLTPDGRILVGAVLRDSQAGVLRYSAAGVLEMDATVPKPLFTTVARVNDVRSSFDGGQFYVAFDVVNQGYAEGVVARMDNDGTPDYTFGDLGLTHVAYDRATADLTADGKLVTVGNRGGYTTPGGPDGSDYTRLEARRLNTAIAAADRIQYRPDGAFSSNNVYVEGTGGNDTITATRLADGRVQVKLNSTARTFPGDADNLEFILVNGGAGNDTINTSASGLDAEANGGYGDDNINLGTGNNPEFGGVYAAGGPGNDTLRGGARDDILVGGGTDANGRGLRAGDGDDLLLGGGGNDSLFGGLGRDRLYGEAGDDSLYGTYDGVFPGFDLRFDGVPDYLDGGTGTDTVFHKESADATGGVENERA